MDEATAVPVIRVRGDASTRGRLVGRAAAQLIHRSLTFYRGYYERYGVPVAALPGLLARYRAAAEAAFPALVAELDGMAEGAEAPPWELFAANAFEEIEPMLETEPAAAHPDRCTAFGFTTEDGTFLAHNEQWFHGDEGTTVVVVADPDPGPPIVSPTVACFLPAIGLNGAGMAQAIMSLSAVDDGVGIPRVLVSRSSLQARDLAEAILLASPSGRAGGYAHLFAFAGGRVFTVETSSKQAAVLGGQRHHTNHYLDPELAPLELDPAWEGTRQRLAKLERLLRERPPSSPEDAMAILADHEPGAQSICLHPEDPDDPESSAVLFGMVCHVESRRIWVAPGNPCRTPFEEINLLGELR
jgi:isopenicillin-N N-acyltransferase like protein